MAARKAFTNVLHADELIKFNRTSSQLYRVLLRSIVRCHREQSNLLNQDHHLILNRKHILVDGEKNHHPKEHLRTNTVVPSMDQSFLLLQPSLQPKEYGLARTFRSNDYLLWTPSLAEKLQDPRLRETFVVENIMDFFTRLSSNHSSSISPPEGDESNNSSSAVHNQSDPSTTTEATSSFHPYPVLFVSCMDLKRALRHCFWRLPKNHPPTLDINKQKILHMHRKAIEAVNLLDEQIRQYLERTSISCDWEKGLRIIVTSKCIGGGSRSSSTSSNNVLTHPTTKSQAREWKYRFAYRIRVEKFTSPSKLNKDSKTVTQLLGRSWFIVEHPESHDTREQALYNFWNHVQDTLFNEEDKNHGDGTTNMSPPWNIDPTLEVVTVQAPTTGAVGHLPVLQNGHVFEYMSGCEISTKNGSMGGCFHFALVDDDTESGYVGDPIDALKLDEDQKFRVLIHPFSLVVE